MITIPLQPVYSQQLSTVLANQVCQINVYQKLFGVFVDIYVNNVLVIGGVLALNRVRIVRDTYLGFSGDLLFFDTQGSDDPDWTGLGTRFLFQYVTAAELAAAGVSG